MFIDVNYKKRPQKAKLHLAKPNKQIISHISEKFGDSLSLKLANINELTFSIPHFIEEEGRYVRNPHADSIKEKMLIRAKMGAYTEWFIVDGIEESADDSEVFIVTAFSLAYELKGKRISGYETESNNATEILTQLLEINEATNKSQTTLWKIGSIDPMFDGMFRSFESGEDSNVLDCITNLAETFGALLVWDTQSRTISFKNMKEDGKFRGMTVNYGRFLKTVNRTRTTDEMVTRLHVQGNEGLTIHSVNPTGQGYIEDFSWFMYPFKRDVNKNVIQSSNFMSDALCHALLDHEALLEANAPEIATLTSEIATKNTELILEQSKLDELNNELNTAEELLDTAKAVLATLESEFPMPDVTSEKALVTTRVSERDAKKSEVSAQEIVVNTLEARVETLQNQLKVFQYDISNQSNFTQELIDELNPYIIESTWRDDNYINADDLYNDAIEKFAEIRQPKVVIEISMDNLMNIVEEQYYWDKLVLGDLIKVKYPQMDIEYMAKIIEISYDLENAEATLVIANTTDLLSETEKLVQLLYGSQSASQLVQNNKYKWNKVNAVSQQVSQMLTSEWDANKNKIIAGVNNSVEVGNRGIIISNPDIPNEMVIMQAGIIALTKDGGETWKTAIKPDGIVAERLIGQIIAGQELLITNSSGSFTMDNNGAIFDVDSFIIRSSSGNGNLVDRWQEGADFVEAYKDDNLITAYEKKMLKIKWEEMDARYEANRTKIINFFEDDGASKAYVTTYYAKYQELYDYLFVTPHGDMPMLASENLPYTTRIIGTDFDAKFKNYDSALVSLESQLDLEAKALSDKAIQDAKDAQADIDEVMNDVVYKIEIYSSNGLTFKNGQINTVLTAKIYRGKDDITSTIPNSGFIWKKTNKDGNTDVAWNTAHANVGKQVTISKDDILQRATFECSIDIPE